MTIAAPSFLELPNYLVFDLETSKLTQRGGDPGKTPISVLCAWGLRDLSPYVWILDSSRFPRVFLAEDHAKETFVKYDGIVTWNGLKFDVPCIKGRVPDIAAAIRRKKHVDLLAISCLLSAGLDPSRVASGLDDTWHRLTPTLREEFLSAGWSLDAVGAGTLQLGKTEGPQGAGAVDAWLEGRYSAVISYCIGDVALTRALFLHAWEHGSLVSRERGRVEIPRTVLA